MSDILNELVVMDDVAKILRDLGSDEQRRVINWLADYFDIYEDDDIEFGGFVVEDGDEEAVVEDEVEPVEPEPDTFATFYERVAPKTAIQKVITSAYWLETQDGLDSWTSFAANKLLKSLGVKISSVSGTLAIEAKKDDSRIVVLEKSGSSMQGRKTFRLSEAGKRFVEDRLA